MPRIRAGALTRGVAHLEKAGRAKHEEFEREQEARIKDMAWDEFLPWFRKHWKQGEHVTMVAPTQQGKSTLAKAIMDIRKYVVVFVTKARDPLMPKLEAEGFKRVEAFIGQPEIYPRQLLVPSTGKRIAPMTMKRKQREAFESAIWQIFDAGKWTVWLDEGRYITDTLKLQGDVEFLFLQGSALKISIVFLTQRPAKVPLEVYDQSTHLFFWRDNDESNRRRIGGLAGESGDILWREVAKLNQYEFIYLNTRTGFVCKSKVDRKEV